MWSLMGSYIPTTACRCLSGDGYTRVRKSRYMHSFIHKRRNRGGLLAMSPSIIPEVFTLV